MLGEWSKTPGKIENIFRAICNVAPSQLADTSLFDFEKFIVKTQNYVNTTKMSNAQETEMDWLLGTEKQPEFNG